VDDEALPLLLAEGRFADPTDPSGLREAAEPFAEAVPPEPDAPTSSICHFA